METTRAKPIKIEGDFAYYEDGSVRWTDGNSQGKKVGALAQRPEYAAEPFSKNSAIRANEERQLKNALAATRGLTKWATKVLDKPVSEEEAIEYAMETIMYMGMAKMIDVKNPLAAVQYVMEKTEAFRDPKTVQRQQERTITINMSEELFRDIRDGEKRLETDVIDGKFRDED